MKGRKLWGSGPFSGETDGYDNQNRVKQSREEVNPPTSHTSRGDTLYVIAQGDPAGADSSAAEMQTVP